VDLPATAGLAAATQRGMTGRLLFPGEDRFDALRRPATNRYQTAPPQAIARCAARADVAQVIDFAGRYGLTRYGQHLPRLRNVKARYDPDDFFHHEQSIPPIHEE
jgi:FAD/FMN-containing dehydrogenase